MLNPKKPVQILNFDILIEQDEDGWFVASVPSLPGCYTQGKSIDQVRRRIRQVIQLTLKSDPKISESINTNKTPRFFGIDSITLPYAQA